MESQNKKILIVGAGVSGLAAGIYLERSGFDVTIYEQHVIAGGLSTSWKRKGYLFEGGMHWLTGSSPELPMNRLWLETGALQENNPIYTKDPVYTLIDGSKTLSLYRDVDKLEKEFIDYAPEDTKEIKRMCRHIRIFRKFHMPVYDVPFLKAKKHVFPTFREFLSMVPALFVLPSLTKLSYVNYVNRFQNENLRHLLMTVIGDRYNALSFVYTMGDFASGDCGYPEGGSLRLTQNMADTFTNLGGIIHYHSPVEKIAIENGTARGVYVDGKLIKADNVLVTADTRKIIDSLFEKPLEEKWVQKMRKGIVSEQTMFIAYGIKADLSAYPRGFIIPLEKPFEAAGLKFGELRINNYAQYPEHAPKGCTALTCLLLGPSYNWWNARKKDGTYKTEKEELARRLIEEIAKAIPEVNGNVEVSDVATPCTYERYCGTFEGSWMSVFEPGGAMLTFPQKSKTVKGLYFAGQRSSMPGGLPIAVYTGRKAAQLICRAMHNKFIGS